MTTNNNMTTTTAAAAIETAAAEKAAPAVWPVRYERMTFGEYLDAIAAGEIAEPVCATSGVPAGWPRDARHHRGNRAHE